MALADEPDSVHAQVIDRLAEVLPERDGAPYLTCRADRCGPGPLHGFGDLVDSEIVIGELWATPRLVARVTEDARDVRGRQEVP